MKTVFGRTVSWIGHNKQSICVIFGALYLAEPGLTAGGRRHFAKFTCFKKACSSSNYSTFRFVASFSEIYCKVVFFKRKISKI